MNAPLRRVGVVVMILFGLLFVNLNYVQGIQATAYRTSDFNGRVQIAEYDRARGKIVVAGEPVAGVQETDGDYKFLRTYPGSATYAHVVGFKPVNGAETGIEKLENEFLAGTSDELVANRLRDMFTGQKTAGGNVELTLSKAGQEAAVRQLAGNDVGARTGAVVALDPETGRVLALASMPSFDPNPLAGHDTAAAEAAYKRLESAAGKPLLNRATSETFPPGSTMKVLVSAAALQAGLTQGSELTGGASYQAPDTTHVIRNAPGVNCGQQITLKQALTVSCNTAFARLGAERIGADRLEAAAEAFGFESEPRFAEDQKDNVFRVAASRTGDLKDPDGTDNTPAVAQSCIGQADVRMTPLQGALVAAAVANGGRQMRPYLIDKLTGPDLSTLHTAEPRTLRQPVSSQVAGDLREMMISVVQGGTGRNARVSGLEVGGKTGTAEAGESDDDHGWFIGFAMKDGEPVVAVAVLLEQAGRGGSTEAARIAGRIIRAIAAEQGLVR